MLLTRKTDYALVALAGLASHQGAASARGLAQQLHLPLPVLRNILKVLTARGLLVSTRGPSGGYRLARPPETINLAEVVEAVEGPVQLVRCCPVGSDDAEPKCRLESSCTIKGNVRQVHERLLEFLGGVTLEQIVEGPGPGVTSQEKLERSPT